MLTIFSISLICPMFFPSHFLSLSALPFFSLSSPPNSPPSLLHFSHLYFCVSLSVSLTLSCFRYGFFQKLEKWLLPETNPYPQIYDAEGKETPGSPNRFPAVWKSLSEPGVHHLYPSLRTGN